MKAAILEQKAFTLVELLVATSLIALILGLLLSTADQTQKIAQRTTARVTTFQAARTGFEAMTRNLGQATLNTYWQVDDPAVPKNFLRQSELHFLAGETAVIFSNPTLAGTSGDLPKRYPAHAVFFQAPLGRTTFQTDLAAEKALDPNLRKYRQLDDLICACGYFVEWDEDRSIPAFLKATQPPRWRYRLMELAQPAERLKLFDKTLAYNSLNPNTGVAKYLSGRRPEWMTRALERKTDGTFEHASVLAENVVALLLLPKLADEDMPAASNGGLLDPQSDAGLAFDSWAPSPGKASGPPYHQLPPIVQVTMVAIDELSAQRQQQVSTDPPGWTSGLFSPDGATVKSRASALGDPADGVKGGVGENKDTLIGRLNRAQMNYRIYSQDVVIRGAKWSND